MKHDQHLVNQGKLTCNNDHMQGFSELFPEGMSWPSEHPLHILISGSEGCGKTTLALQLALCSNLEHSVGTSTSKRVLRCVIYYTTDDILDRIEQKVEVFNMPRMAEKVIRMTRLTENTSRLDRIEYNDMIFALHKLEPSLQKGMKDRILSVDMVVQTVANQLEILDGLYSPDEYIVIIDSIAGISDTRKEFQLLIGGFGKQSVNGLTKPAVVIFTDESGSTVKRSPYLCDAVINVSQGNHSESLDIGFCERYIQVVKLANARHARGLHTFHILRKYGIEIWPSSQLQVGLIRGKRSQTRNRGNKEPDLLKYGLPDAHSLDLLPKGSTTFLYGPAETMKTPQSMYFITEELDDGAALYISFNEEAHKIISDIQELTREKQKFSIVCLESIDASTEGIKSDTQLVVLQSQDYFVSPSSALTYIRRLIETLTEKTNKPISRCVIAGINQIDGRFPRLSKETTFLPLLNDILRSYDCTTLFVADGTKKRESEAINGVRYTADSVFAMETLGTDQNAHVLLNVEKLGSSPTGVLPVLELRRHYKGGQISTVKVTDRYARSSSGKLIPVRVHLYLNNFAPTHDMFNQLINNAFANVSTLDNNITRLRGINYDLKLTQLSLESRNAVVLAVDEACPVEEWLHYFCDLDTWGVDRLNECIPTISERCILDTSVRLVPSCIDFSIVMFYPKVIACYENAPLTHILCNKIDEQRRKGILPVVEIQELIRAAREWDDDQHRLDNAKSVRFFDAVDLQDMENLLTLMIEWIRAYNTTEDYCSLEIEIDEDIWVEALDAFADVFLAGTKRKLTDPSPKSLHDDSTPGTSLFYRSWHSIAFGSPETENAVPVRIGKNWKSTRGGWFWGILDTGQGREIGMNILKFSQNQQMDAFKIAQTVYLPADVSLLDHQEGNASLYNTGLMLKEYRNACSRAKIGGYRRLSPLLYNFFASYLDYIRRTRDELVEEELRKDRKNWLRSRLVSLKLCSQMKLEGDE